jgi:hypothetical protein
MIRKTTVISLILSLLFGLAGINELLARDGCFGKCCCAAPEAAGDLENNPDRFFGLIPVCSCCQNEGMVSCGDLQEPAQTSPDMAFSQELSQKAPGPDVFFASIFRAADPIRRLPAIEASDRFVGKYQLLPIYLCNLSLLI